MKRLTIVHFSQDFTYNKPHLGGYGRVLNMLDKNHKHIVYTTSNKNNLIVKNFNLQYCCEVRQVPFYINRKNIYKRFLSVKKISSYIANDIKKNKIKPTIFFGHSQLPNFYILKNIKTKINSTAPIIWEFNAIWGGINVKSVKNRIAIFLLKFFEKKIVKCADALIFQTSEGSNFVKKMYGDFKGIHKIIPNAVSEIFLSNIKKEFIPSKVPKVLVNGLFDSMNGLSLIYKYIIEKVDIPVEFHFIGSGPFEEKIKSLSKIKNIFIYGSVSRKKMENMYKNFDYHIIPRKKCFESDFFIPSKLIESMAVGVVPIVSNVNAMTEVVSEKEGFIINPDSINEIDNVIQKISNLSTKDWKKKAELSSKKIKIKYVWEENHKILLELYEKLCKN